MSETIRVPIWLIIAVWLFFVAWHALLTYQKTRLVRELFTVREKDFPAPRTPRRSDSMPSERERFATLGEVIDALYENEQPATPERATASETSLNPAATLSDFRLLERAREIVREMCRGDRWHMSIPTQSEDSDMVISELIDRYAQLRTATTPETTS